MIRKHTIAVGSKLEAGRLPIWVAAAMLALGAHVGCAALAFWNRDSLEYDDEPAGNIVLELSPILATSETATLNLPVGPESAESVASEQQAISKPTPPEESEVPIAAPSPTDPEPDLAVPEPQKEVKPVEEQEPEVQQPEVLHQAASEASVASQAMAPLVVEAPPAPKASAPQQGLSARQSRSAVSWHQSIVTHLNRFKRFPADASSQITQAQVVVQFAIERSGRVLTATVIQSSGSAALDQEAITMLHRAAPLPRPTADIQGETFDLTVPVVFRRR